MTRLPLALAYAERLRLQPDTLVFDPGTGVLLAASSPLDNARAEASRRALLAGLARHFIIRNVVEV